MAKKTKASTSVTHLYTGLTGDEGGVPDFLLVKNRKPLTAEQQAKLASHVTKQQPDRVDGRKPKGMAWEDWDAYQQRSNVEHKAANEEKFAALRAGAKPRVPSVRKAAGLLDANHFAPLCGCEAKVVRRALRDKKQTTIKKPAYGWCFPKEDEAKVVAVVKAYLARKGKDKAAVAPAAKVQPVPVKPAGKPAKAKGKPLTWTQKAKRARK
jgi:hypothetical protein